MVEAREWIRITNTFFSLREHQKTEHGLDSGAD
jgi:hypothetical protein